MGKFEIGDTIQFGDYQWLILDKEADRVLIITEDIIAQRPYNDYAGEVTWHDCALRKYLNGEFYESFTVEEQSKIKLRVNQNSDNQWYGAAGGEATEDYVFLLTIEDVVCKYFGDSRKNLENPSAKQRYWFQRKDSNNIRRRASYEGYVWWWWLRSPGRDNKRAVYIHGDGNIGIQGNATFRYSSDTRHPLTNDNSGGVRPALWLEVAKIIEVRNE